MLFCLIKILVVINGNLFIYTSKTKEFFFSEVGCKNKKKKCIFGSSKLLTRLSQGRTYNAVFYCLRKKRPTREVYARLYYISGLEKQLKSLKNYHLNKKKIVEDV